ncbi:MAG: hypothetical protein EXR63_01150 [Dehalococcoidia bacterium]|nr:hypothetical protein [Dehalococcoidia bacterium]
MRPIALPVAHEVDAARWVEWRIFRLPGGGTAFVLLHVPLAALLMHGYTHLTNSARGGSLASLLLACAGVGTVAIHGTLLARGRPEFRSASSLSVLAATGLVSLVQLAATVRPTRLGRTADRA